MKEKPRARPYAVEFTPLDYRGETPKLSQSDIIKQAKREGEILKAHHVSMTATKEEKSQAKKTIEPPAIKKEAPPQTTPAPTTPAQAQQKQGYQFSEKAKSFFAKFHSKAKEPPQKEQEQTNAKRKEKSRER
jgi:hypothetical protein